MGHYRHRSPIKKGWEEITRDKIEHEIRDRGGYSVEEFRRRLFANAYDAIKILEDISYLAPMKFFDSVFKIHPRDFKRKPK